MAEGKLAPDSVVSEAIKPVLTDRDGYVLDGFPRNLEQTEGLEFDAVIYLDVPDEVVTQRLMSRGRADDRKEVIVARLKQYEAETKPLVEHYRDQGVLLRVDGDRPADEITDELLRLVKNVD